MKKLLRKILLLSIIVSAVIFSGCSTTSETASEPDTGKTNVDDTSHSTPKGSGWMLEVSGVRSDEIWESNFEKWKEDPSSEYGEYTFEKKGQPVPASAMPLRNIVAVIDDPDGTMPYSFMEDLWNEGYDLTFTASDGYSITVSTADIDPNDLYLADSFNGERVSPMILGNVSTQYWVRDLVSISASLEAVSLEDNDFQLLIEIGGKSGAYTIGELEQLDSYIEGRGNFTNSHDNTFGYLWGGVKIVDLINTYTSLTNDMSVTIEAMDGYAMTYSGKQFLDNPDGDWILAFKENGEYMPEDPGYIRLVKVGPDNPNITGHTSARMVKKIIINSESFENFDIEIVSGKGTEVMDAQTLMSGVTTHRAKVNYLNKSYMGIPVYILLERYSGYNTVTIEAADGFSISLDASELMNNNDVIMAMFMADESPLDKSEYPLVLVWDKDTSIVPAGIKSVRNVTRIIIE